MIQGADVVLDRFVKTCDFPYRFVVAYQVKGNASASVAASGKTFGDEPAVDVYRQLCIALDACQCVDEALQRHPPVFVVTAAYKHTLVSFFVEFEALSVKGCGIATGDHMLELVAIAVFAVHGASFSRYRKGGK